jgi:hypothetical protein
MTLPGASAAAVSGAIEEDRPPAGGMKRAEGVVMATKPRRTRDPKKARGSGCHRHLCVIVEIALVTERLRQRVDHVAD